jgi:hypothetical protein
MQSAVGQYGDGVVSQQETDSSAFFPIIMGEQRLHTRHDVIQFDQLRMYPLFSAEGQQVLREARGPLPGKGDFFPWSAGVVLPHFHAQNPA